ncbi:MAG: peptidoglycan -binding protein [Acetobacteraceae bacterium]|nr:peptidoglycan -binding protein [Acetobacteraceae bacterium]
MVIIFVLLVFVLAQAFLSVALSGRDQALDRVNRQLAEVSDMLSLERGRTSELKNSIAELNRELQSATQARDSLAQQLAGLREQAERAVADRDSLRSERDKLSAQLADAGLRAQSAEARTKDLQAQLAEAAGRADKAGQDTAAVAAQLAEAKRQLAEMQRQAAELDKTVQADKATIEARLSDLAKLAEQTRALTALRDELEKQAQDSAAKAMTEQQRRQAVEAQLAGEKKLGDSARAQIALLSRQIDDLKTQLARLSKDLDLAQSTMHDKDVQIANLGQRLNAALAEKVEQLQLYRSEFFGKLREVLANRPGVQIVGDRFVFQSEVLFPVGSAELTQAGTEQIKTLATTIKQIAADIPKDLHWVLRVDGHADKQPISHGVNYASNWELSAGRAITVVKLLIAEGVPPDHLAATGFADYQPLDPSDTSEAYAKNRRIELRLTDR